MGIPRFEVLAGTPDGVNTTFFTSTAYTSGSVAVFINGQLKREDYEDGWIEADPSTGEVTLKEAPLAYEVVQAFFLDTSPPGPEQNIENLTGIVECVDELTGQLSSAGELVGVVDAVVPLVGAIEGSELSGIVDDVVELTGQIEVC